MIHDQQWMIKKLGVVRVVEQRMFQLMGKQKHLNCGGFAALPRNFGKFQTHVEVSRSDRWLELLIFGSVAC